MKVIIVGAGIGGLSAYLALKKHLSSLFDTNTLTITLVEAYPSPSQHTYSAAGNGLGLAPNGLRAISTITKAAVPFIYSHGFTKGSFMTFRNHKGKALGAMQFGTEERYGFHMCIVPRAVVHEGLLKEVDEKSIKWGLRVIGVRELNEDKGGVIVEYDDGTEEKADLVIGADGVRSVVKDSLFKGKYQAQYDGLTGIGGFLPVSSLPWSLQKSLETEGITMTFGTNGFFGYSLCSPLSPSRDSGISKPFIQWWAIYESETIPDKKTINYEDVKAQLLKRHGDWVSPYDDKPNSNTEKVDKEKQSENQRLVFRTIIELSFPSESTSNTPSRPLILPRFVTPRLPAWSNATYTDPSSIASNTSPSNKGRIVLLGDAAHTMPPDVGQGVSCAAEDSVVYAMLLKHYLDLSQAGVKTSNISTSVLEKTAKAYELIRKPRIHQILDQGDANACAKKELNSFVAWLRDCAIWILCKLPESIHDSMFAYDAEAVVSKFVTEHPSECTRL